MVSILDYRVTDTYSERMVSIGEQRVMDTCLEDGNYRWKQSDGTYLERMASIGEEKPLKYSLLGV